jgi:hypothetical protein
MNTDGQGSRTETRPGLRARLFGWLFAAEWEEHCFLKRQCGRLGAREFELSEELHRLRAALARLQPHPARMAYKPRLAREQITELLAGTHGLGPVQAVMALLEEHIVRAGDLAGTPPAEAYTDPRTHVPVPGFSEPMRTHAAGQLDGLAKVLGELQELTAAQVDNEATKAK